jgi:DNA-binding NtrC family response regulator
MNPQLPALAIMNQVTQHSAQAPARTKVLLIDDEAGTWLPPLANGLAPLGFDLVDESRAIQAYNAVRRDRPDVVLLDLHFPGDERRKDGLTAGAGVLHELRQAFPALPIVVFTTRLQDDQIPLDQFEIPPHGRFGKHHIDPSNAAWPTALARALRDAIQAARATAWPPVDDLGFTVHTEGAMRPFVERMYVAARQRLNIAIVGEPGIGRLRAALAVHRLGVSASSVKVLTCESLTPEAIAEASAAASSDGTVVLANLDQLPASAQPALAAWLKASQRVPDPLPHAVPPIRFIVTSRVAPELLVQSGELRSDIVFSLGADILEMPPLRNRLDDLPALFCELVAQAGRRMDKHVTTTLRPEVLKLLKAHHWPGNIPELNAVVTRAVAKTTSNVLLPEDIELSAVLIPTRQGQRVGASSSDTGNVIPEVERNDVGANAIAFLDQLDSVPAAGRYGHLIGNTKGTFRREVLLDLIRKLGQGGRPVQGKHLVKYLDPSSPSEAASARIRQALRECKISLRSEVKKNERR